MPYQFTGNDFFRNRIQVLQHDRICRTGFRIDARIITQHVHVALLGPCVTNGEIQWVKLELFFMDRFCKRSHNNFRYQIISFNFNVVEKIRTFIRKSKSAITITSTELSILFNDQTTNLRKVVNAYNSILIFVNDIACASRYVFCNQRTFFLEKSWNTPIFLIRLVKSAGHNIANHPIRTTGQTWRFFFSHFHFVEFRDFIDSERRFIIEVVLGVKD